ncbi:MAG: hypothetical protein AAF414_12650 [Pseudomonadota bacterium]
MKRICLVALASIIGLSPVLTASAQTNRLTAAGPDLVPIASRIENGAVSIRNMGAAASGPSVARLTCSRVGGGSCAEEVPGMRAYIDPAYPHSAVIQIPAIPPGHVHTHYLTFWDDLVWNAGTYNLLLEADAGWDVPEINEGNNFNGYAYVVQ